MLFPSQKPNEIIDMLYDMQLEHNPIPNNHFFEFEYFGFSYNKSFYTLSAVKIKANLEKFAYLLRQCDQKNVILVVEDFNDEYIVSYHTIKYLRKIIDDIIFNEKIDLLLNG